MPTFLIWNLILILTDCSNFLNLTKNYELLTKARFFLENQEIQINEYRDYFSHFQYIFPDGKKKEILQAYTKYIAILVKNRNGELLTMRQVKKYLNLSSFIADAKLQHVLLNKILSVHYLLHPNGGLFTAKGLAHFILKAHLYLHQLEYNEWDYENECGIVSAIDSLHHFLFCRPEKDHKKRILLGTSYSNIKSHPILISSTEKIGEKSLIKSNRDPESLKNRYSRHRSYRKKGVTIGLFLALLFFAMMAYLKLTARALDNRGSGLIRFGIIRPEN
jgi:hypothetical protein